MEYGIHVVVVSMVYKYMWWLLWYTCGGGYYGIHVVVVTMVYM